MHSHRRPASSAATPAADAEALDRSQGRDNAASRPAPPDRRRATIAGGRFPPGRRHGAPARRYRRQCPGAFRSALPERRLRGFARYGARHRRDGSSAARPAPHTLRRRTRPSGRPEETGDDRRATPTNAAQGAAPARAARRAAPSSRSRRTAPPRYGHRGRCAPSMPPPARYRLPPPAAHRAATTSLREGRRRRPRRLPGGRGA